MIAASTTTGQIRQTFSRPHWQQALADAISNPAELCDILGLDPGLLPGAAAAAEGFALRVPRGFVARMRHGDPRDPLLLQVLPRDAENRPVPGFSLDPVGDMASRAGAGVLHKYRGRALLIATGACAVHCRYCFRRHFPYGEESALSAGWQSAIESLQADPSISEVILSGGDPLSLSDRRLTQLTDALRTVPHVRRLRIHTRYPVVLPERVDAGLLHWLSHLPLQKVMVIHANHANELNRDVGDACRAIAACNVTLLNQSVLLAGINDSVEALATLSETLFACGVLPYYLHLLDRVQGAAHFEVDEPVALRLHAGLMRQLPGYLVPRLVREVPGAPSKTPVTLEAGGC
ncbi:MAG TPA: EF-P beta-lysylation protein EpmB [Povalibacter sp.]|nr:EF-P beta-lysylation protein EpmB [Povalibacter sp.]